MLNSKYLLVYGLSQEENSILSSLADGSIMASLAFSSEFEDIFNLDYSSLVLNLNSLALEEVEKYNRYLAEVDSASIEKILLSKNKTYENSNCHVYETFQQMTLDFVDLVNKSTNRAKKTENTSKNIASVLSIYKALITGPKSTEELAKITTRDQAACKRFIELLNLSGITIKYDYAHKKWHINP